MGITITKPSKSLEAIILDVIDKAVVPKVQEDVKAIADDVRQKLVDKIRSNGYDFPELEAKYAKRKELEHPGEPMLVASEQYIESIEVEKIPGGYTVGVSNKVHFGRNGEHPTMMREIAHTLEYGDPERNIPPRPHWRPALDNLRRRQRFEIQKMREKAIKEADKALKAYLRLPQVKESRG